MVAQIGGEHVHRACEEEHGAVGMPAGAAAADIAGPAGQEVQRSGARLPGRDLVEGVGDCGQAHVARPALAGSLAGEEGQHAIGLGDAARRRRSDDEDAGSK